MTSTADNIEEGKSEIQGRGVGNTRQVRRLVTCERKSEQNQKVGCKRVWMDMRVWMDGNATRTPCNMSAGVGGWHHEQPNIHADQREVAVALPRARAARGSSGSNTRQNASAQNYEACTKKFGFQNCDKSACGRLYNMRYTRYVRNARLMIAECVWSDRLIKVRVDVSTTCDTRTCGMRA